MGGGQGGGGKGQQGQQGQKGQGAGGGAYSQYANDPDYQRGYADGFNDGWGDGQPTTDEHGGVKAGGQAGVDTNSVKYINFRGQQIALDPVDIVQTPEEAGMTKQAIEQASKNFLIGIVERHRRQFGTFGGDQAGYFERLVEEALAPRVNWKSAIRKRFMDVSGRDRSYRTPDRRFVHSGTYFAGLSPQVPDMLKNLKVCVDTSGSIGNEDIGVLLSQLKQLLTEFKCKDAEIIFWDTQVRERTPFDKYEDVIKNAKFSGGGGTDCNCVFEEFDSEPYRNRKKGKPGYIIIFTDGCFGPIDAKYKKWGNHTIWVLPDFATLQFKPPFGLKSEFQAADSKPKK